MVRLEQCPVCGSVEFIDFLELKDFFLTKETFNLQKCGSCGFVFTNPIPEKELLPRYYDSPDYLSHHSHSMSIINLVYQGLRQINIKRKFSLVSKFVPKGALLDIGCGTGELLNYFHHQKWEVSGIEPSESARKFAIEKYGLKIEDESGLNNFQENSFDVITMWHVLEHVSDLNGRISEVYKLLKNSGYLFIALPNLNSWDALHYKHHWAAFDVPRHLYHFSKSTIVELLKKHQFTFEKSFPMKMDAYFVSMLSEKYLGKHNANLKAAIKGFLSNKNARKNGEYSSLIYVFKK